jgi:carbon monoxide dehydrogenase subunit G
MKLSFRLKQPIDTVFAHLTDMQQFVLVHPVIYQIDELGENSYLVHERLKLGFIPFSFTYPVTIEKNFLAKKIMMRARVFKLTSIEMKFSLTIEEGFTIVAEEIQFESPFPVKLMMEKIFKTQHEKLFKNLEGK